ncbi:MAG TPA: hypothetical protein VGK93_01555 [Candidatus Eisenbacteria bacterium]|jgi:hypothetical protein
MHRIRIGLIAFVLAASFSGAGCLLIPEIQDRVVQLATNGSASVVFEANGPETASLDEVSVVSIGDGTELDLRRILEDAGVDVSEVVDAKVEKVEYAITRADPMASRTVEDKVTVQWQGTEKDLITGFSANVGVPTGYRVATLQTAGVGEINRALKSVLDQLKAGLTPTESVTFRVTGTTTPNSDSSRAIDFEYSVKLTVSIVGSVSMSVPD